MRMSLPVTTHSTLAYEEGFTETTMQKTNLNKAEYDYQLFKDPRESRNYLPDAIDEYMKAMEQDDNPMILARLAKMYALNGQMDRAAVFVEKTLQRGLLKNNVVKEVLEVQADLAFRKGEYEQSKQFLKQALHLEKPWQRAKLYSGLACVDMALSHQEQSVLTKTKTFGLFGLGMVFYCFSKPWHCFKPVLSLCSVVAMGRLMPKDRMVGCLHRLYQRYPGLEHLPVEIGKVYLQKGQFLEAEFWLYGATQRHPASDEGYRYLSELYQQTGNVDQLLEILAKWLQIRPQSGEIMFHLSQVLAHQPERLNEAIQYAQNALMYLKNPMQQASVYGHLGNLYSYLQSYDAAIMAYQASLHLNPSYLDTYISLGTLYYDKQEYGLSQAVFEKALTLSPQNARILCNLGYLAWMQGKIADALTYYQRSVALDPAYDIALNNLGVLYLDHIGDVQKALTLFDQTLEYNPNYALCYYNKGRAYSFLGKTIEAAQCFTQAQDLNEMCQELDNGELTERIRQLFENTPEHLQNTDL